MPNPATVPAGGATVPESAPPRDAGLSSSSARSLRLLTHLAAQGRALSLAELSEALDLPKATAHRLCLHLQELGFVARDVNDREYVVGPALRKLALDALNHGTVRGLRHEVLSDLVNDVGETCNFTTLDGAGVLYLDRVEAPRPWRWSLETGVHVPLHCTASGKLFLATMPAARRRRLLQTLSLPRMTSKTLLTPQALEAECAQIAQQDHSFDREEFIDGLVAAAVPVRDATGTVRAAVAVHAPLGRLSLEPDSHCVQALRAAAVRMTALL